MNRKRHSTYGNALAKIACNLCILFAIRAYNFTAIYKTIGASSKQYVLHIMFFLKLLLIVSYALLYFFISSFFHSAAEFKTYIRIHTHS